MEHRDGEPPSPTRSPPPASRLGAGRLTGRLRATIALSGLGHVVHNLEEFGLGAAFAGQTGVPAAVTVALFVAACRPTRRFLRALLAWVVVVIVLGGGSVFPWPFLPFVPAQTVSHYATHLAYALLQVPALAVAWRALRTARDDERRHEAGGMRRRGVQPAR